MLSLLSLVLNVVWHCEAALQRILYNYSYLYGKRKSNLWLVEFIVVLLTLYYSTDN